MFYGQGDGEKWKDLRFILEVVIGFVNGLYMVVGDGRKEIKDGFQVLG